MKYAYAISVAGMVWLVGGGACLAAEDLVPRTAVVQPQSVDGESTRLWLAAQRQGSGATATPQPLSGRVQEKIYERYEKSFTREIPENFERERFNVSGSGR
jgi:hypothetical protein